MSVISLLPRQRELLAAKARVRASHTVAMETSVSEARWMLWPVFGLWIALVAAGLAFG
jgi:hypothetical protein